MSILGMGVCVKSSYSSSPKEPIRSQPVVPSAVATLATPAEGRGAPDMCVLQLAQAKAELHHPPFLCIVNLLSTAKINVRHELLRL